MSLTSGTKLGSYEILSPLGAGGMGEVYRARDTKLGREVAIKVLPEEFTEHPQKLARFEREAKLLAALNHPGIATLHGLEEFEGKPFLVMELVEGETLADRISLGPIPVGEALTIAQQIAEAVEAAHEKGVIHRDLKPANIKVDPEGKVKVLDFGLAKAFAEEVPESELSQSPTLSRDATRAGVILGTAAYMSPEQAKGKTVDKRTDIFSFGIVLYEMLTGRKAFAGEDVPEVLASIIGKEPDWTTLPNGLDSRLDALLRRCLRKDKKKRLQAIGDVRVEIEDVLGQPKAATEDVRISTSKLPWIMASLAGMIAVGILGWHLSRSEPSSSGVARLAVSLPFDHELPSGGQVPFGITADGKRLAYVTTPGGALYVRDIDSFEARPIPGVEGATNPFFSPDGQWIAYRSSDGFLKKVSVSGGAAQTLCDVAGGPTLSGSWGSDGTIVFDLGTRFLWRISSDGGAPEPIAEADRTKGELLYLWPQILPDGDTVLFTVTTSQTAHAAIRSLRTGEQRIVAEDVRGAVYVPTGHLVYTREGQLYAAGFDLERGLLSGEPVQVGQMVSTSTAGAAQFRIAGAGVLAYLQGGSNLGRNQLMWVDRRGGATPLSDDDARYEYPQLSPDGKYLTVALHTELGGHDIWVYDIERRSRSRLTFGEQNTVPFWSADGLAITFETTREGGAKIYRKLADGSGDAEPLPIDTPRPFSGIWSPDGSGYVFGVGGSMQDIWWWPQGGEPHAIVSSPYDERSPRISPDGRWLAYASDESGQTEVYVRPFPELGARYLVSRDGGGPPVWSRDGKEIFYRRGDQMTAVSITTEPSFNAGIPEVLFEGQYELRYPGHPNFDVSLDGKRFIMVRTDEETAPPNQINIVLNWHEELKRLVRTN